MNKLPPNKLKLPPIVPAGDYRMDVLFFNENPLIVLAKVFVNIRAKGLHVLKMG